MYHPIAATLLLTILLQPATMLAQARGTPQPQPQRGQRGAPAKPPAPMTLRQVIEALSSLRNSSRVEEQISKAGVQFVATPDIVDILKQFGAGPKLISMIPAPLPPPQPPPPKIAGALTVICEPKDCTVAVNETYQGPTSQNRKTINGLHPGEATVEVFAEGYEHLTRKVELEEDKPREEKFSLKRNTLVRQQSASATMLKAVASLGGTDGLEELGDFEGSGTLQWTNDAGQVEQWTMSFNKRIGRDLTTTFKTKDGQCTASILLAATKQDCRGGLRNGGDKIADQATTLLLSYQLQDVINALVKRPLIASDTDDNRLESPDAKDSYVLTIGSDGLPTDLVYRVGSGDAPIQVQYSNYLYMTKARYPGRIAIGRLNSPPVWIFTVNSVRSRVVRGQ